MITLNDFLFFGILMAMLFIGLGVGVLSTTSYRKTLDKEYKRMHDEIRNTVRKETKNEWSAGWDAACNMVRDRYKIYYIWFREHGYDTKEIEEWSKEYLADHIVQQQRELK